MVLCVLQSERPEVAGIIIGRHGSCQLNSQDLLEFREFPDSSTPLTRPSATLKASAGGKDMRYTDVFVKRDGRWQYVTVTAYSIKAR
jgi:hypothetical protein